MSRIPFIIRFETYSESDFLFSQAQVEGGEYGEI